MKQADSVGAAGATLLPKAGAGGGSGGDGVPGVDGLELFQGVITEELEATLIAEVDRLLVLGEEGKL
eukprot:gene25551-32359_t